MKKGYSVKLMIYYYFIIINSDLLSDNTPNLGFLKTVKA